MLAEISYVIEKYYYCFTHTRKPQCENKIFRRIYYCLNTPGGTYLWCYIKTGLLVRLNCTSKIERVCFTNLTDVTVQANLSDTPNHIWLA